MTKPEAESLGNQMKSQLGKDWIVHIHENFGWHVSVYSPTKHLVVSPTGVDGKYYCLMTSNPENYLNCGEPFWTEHISYNSPVEAVLGQLKHARKVVNELNFAVMQVEEAASKFVCNGCGKKLI